MADETKALSTEVNLNDAAQALREKIRTAFVELITPEQWDAMVKTELDAFVNERTVVINPGYSRDTKKLPSVFHEVCEEVYRAHLKGLIKAELTKPEWNADWQMGGEVMSPAIKQWLTDNADKLLHTTLQELFGGIAQRIVANLRQG